MPIHLKLLTWILTLAAPAARGASQSSAALPNAFFAMDTATKDEKHQTVASQLRMVKELGFAGWAMNADARIDETLKLCDELHLKLFAIYTGLDVNGSKPAWDPKLPEMIRTLKGRQTIVWLFITSKDRRESRDEVAVEGIRQIAEMAAASNTSVSLYPHNGFYMARTRDAIRLARRADRKNVTVTFNLCHWLRTDGGKELDAILHEARPLLSIVTINGADAEGKDWDRLIQPLGNGDYDVYGLLVKLQRLGFAGPVGLQGYGVKGDVNQHLQQAMTTWETYRKRMAKEKAKP